MLNQDRTHVVTSKRELNQADLHVPGELGLAAFQVVNEDLLIWWVKFMVCSGSVYWECKSLFQASPNCLPSWCRCLLPSLSNKTSLFNCFFFTHCHFYILVLYNYISLSLYFCHWNDIKHTFKFETNYQHTNLLIKLGKLQG